MKRRLWSALPVAVVLLLLSSALFIVDETELVIVSQFGNPIRVIDHPGLHLKAPAPIHTLLRFDKRLSIYNVRPSEFLTQDKKNIVVESFIAWRIADARKFLQTVKDRNGAEVRLGDMANSELGSALGTLPLSAILSVDPSTVKIGEVMDKVSANCADKARANYGIQIAAVTLMRLNFPEQNKDSVYNRMRSERDRIAKQYRAEGQEKAQAIKAETEKEVAQLLSEAYSKAEAIKGEGDAAAARIYAAAYRRDPDFYKFLRTLDSYTKFLDEQTTLVLSSDAQLLKLLENGEGK
ncbi:MAG: protease modulator HflC [Myxococcales bacterium]|nr:protease modulator HflC [Myxococcales bacterium]